MQKFWSEIFILERVFGDFEWGVFGAAAPEFWSKSRSKIKDARSRILPLGLRSVLTLDITALGIIAPLPSAGADHGGIQARLHRVLAQWGRPVALTEAKDLLYRQMCGGCYPHRQKAFKMSRLYKDIDDHHHHTLLLW